LLVIAPDGHVQRIGVVKTSGIMAFDAAALESVQQASPYGPVPSAIVSRDGNVYMHREFHRDEARGCSTTNARPFLLDARPPGAHILEAVDGSTGSSGD
jgi:TonB family protein